MTRTGRPARHAAADARARLLGALAACLLRPLLAAEPEPSCTGGGAPSPWADVPMGPTDAILGLTQAFNEDESPAKINLGVGAYRDDHGKPYVLEAVRLAEANLTTSGLNKEYLPISGYRPFLELAPKLMLGEGDAALGEGRLATVQTLSGTGAVRVAAEFIARFGAVREVHVPAPTWANHHAIFRDAGLSALPYKYWDERALGLDLDGMLDDLSRAHHGAAVLLHACAHNPTGVDPSAEQWQKIADVVERRRLLVLFDSAYQGFTSGDPEADAYAVRLFARRGHHLLLAQSFAKNLGLYAERVGALSVVTASPEERARVESQLKLVIRPMYSSPPVHGARIVALILSDEKLKGLWLKECRVMAERIIAMRKALRAQLLALQPPGAPAGAWAHVSAQTGMFCYSGLSAAQVDELRAHHHVYITRDGRISMAGVTTGNVKQLAAAIHAVAPDGGMPAAGK